MPNYDPSPATRFQPQPDGTQMIRTQVYLRPDQVARLDMEENKSAVIRAALDQYFTIHVPDDGTDYGTALDAMSKEPLEIDEV